VENRFNRCTGESLVECVVVLALIAILVVTVAMGLGQRSSNRLMSADTALQGQGIAARPAPAGKEDEGGRHLKDQSESDSADSSESSEAR
jgi:Tfp pilus assembly protein FimT